MLHVVRRGKIRKFGRVKNKKEALYKALVTALIDHGRIKTTTAKARSLSRFADKLVSKAKNKNIITSRRLIRQRLGERATQKLIGEIGPRFKERNGGYTKILRLGRRASDGAEMAIIEFTQ